MNKNQAELFSNYCFPKNSILHPIKGNRNKLQNCAFNGFEKCSVPTVSRFDPLTSAVVRLTGKVRSDISLHKLVIYV